MTALPGYVLGTVDKFDESAHGRCDHCAVNNGDPHKFYICSRLTTEEEIRQNTRSAYYPIEISQTVESIRKRDENVAIVCLPCQAKALRLAMKQDKRLESNVKYIIGLVCGGLRKTMVEYIARAINIKLGRYNPNNLPGKR